MKIYLAGNITPIREKMMIRVGGIEDYLVFIIMVKIKNFMMSFY